MFSTLQVITTVVLGVMVGVEFAVPAFINPMVNSLPEDAGQLARAFGGRRGGKVMPFWYFGSLGLVTIWAVAGWDRDGTGLVVASGVLLIVSVIMSIALLVPINNRTKNWTPENRPADWKEQMRRWDRWHHGRIAVIVASFACLVAALV
ncbi:anthrone oxygenase family protein [Streptomyces sp. NPDC050418]|uniref:anthrone oxygenase family protein n=1 Tax=Streptomyces sp. NPDC050418 TaxID=3365612 RepID=UPI00379F355F